MSESSCEESDRASWPLQDALNVVITVDGGVVRCDVVPGDPAAQRRERAGGGFPGKSIGQETVGNKRQAG